jgi:hypothetical protein
MYAYETVVPVGHEAERLTSAFYRFLEFKGVPSDADVSVHTEIFGAQQRFTVNLWSEEATQDLRKYLNRFQLPRPMGLARQVGPPPFSDV